jgi:CheY-like chemotaxis protein/anti-sigma regulatory factor (Ser/Thr protein kinase)
MAVESLSRPQRARLEVIRESGETLLSLLNDVLDLSKVEAGKLELEATSFDLAELVTTMLAPFRQAAEAKGLEVRLSVSRAAQGFYLGDPTRVRQILGNLLSNAVKFTEAGRIRLAVRVARSGFSIRVSDTGIGIAEHRLSEVFSKFEQADASTTRRFGGTGLGLAICRELAELMGGSVKVASQIGAGTTLTVTLPLPRTVGGPAAKPAARREVHPFNPGGAAPRVLAAEDNPVNRLVLRTLLNQAGIDPLIVEDGLAALDAWEKGAWDVILMDMQMPLMDGAAATRAIRDREAQTKRARTPILALTADVMSHQVADYLASGMDGFIAKPIAVTALFEALEAALQPAEAAARSETAAA